MTIVENMRKGKCMWLCTFSFIFGQLKGGRVTCFKMIPRCEDIAQNAKNCVDNLEKGCRLQEKRLRVESQKFPLHYWPRPPIFFVHFRGQLITQTLNIVSTFFFSCTYRKHWGKSFLYFFLKGACLLLW